MQNAVMAPSELLALWLFSSNTYSEVPGFSNQTRFLILKRKGCSWKAVFWRVFSPGMYHFIHIHFFYAMISYVNSMKKFDWVQNASSKVVKNNKKDLAWFRQKFLPSLKIVISKCKIWHLAGCKSQVQFQLRQAAE